MNKISTRNVLNSGTTSNSASFDPHSAVLPESSKALAGLPILGVITGEVIAFSAQHWLNAGGVGGALLVALNGAAGGGGTGGGLTPSTDVPHGTTIPDVFEVAP